VEDIEINMKELDPPVPGTLGEFEQFVWPAMVGYTWSGLEDPVAARPAPNPTANGLAPD
jgi:hypothetical protein